MQKRLPLVIGVVLCLAITACTKADIEPNEPSLNVSDVILKGAGTPKNNIVILGGSTAWGQGASLPQYAWVNKLAAKLKTVDAKDTVINLAFPGYTTYHIMASGFKPLKDKRPAADTIRNITTALSKHPVLVIISLPSNDIYYGFSDEEILNNYKAVVNTLDREKIPYILTSNQPRSFEEYSERRRLRTFTDLLVKTFPGHVVDYLGKLGDNSWAYKPLYNRDGIHPNDAGHDVIYNSFITFAPFKKMVGMK